MENKNNTQTQPVLLLKGTRYSVEGRFRAFGEDIDIDQQPGGNADGSHEAKTGLTIWDAAIVLAKFFENSNLFPPGHFKDKVVVELGSGCGLVGLSIATQKPKKVYLTDLPSLLPLIKSNIKRNSFASDHAEGVSLVWGENPFNTLPKDLEVDYIIASDCLWVDYLVEPFVDTIKEIATTKTTVYISHEQRAKKTEDHFRAYARNFFEIDMVPYVDMNEEYRDRYISVFKLKKRQ